MPKHIAILFLLLGTAFALALVGKAYLTDPSFYRFGDYRADAVTELAAGTPLFRGGQYCRTCHEGGFVFGSGGAHGSVQCEVCHGADPEHPDNLATWVPAETTELCTLCHEAMPARPAGHPQVVSAEHPSPEEAGAQCHGCHDPHAPGDGGPAALAAESAAVSAADASASRPAAVSKCAKCHGEFGEGRKKNPSIAGMESSAFIDLMNLYRSGAREHKAMNKYAGDLSAEEIVEIAAYYERLPAASPQ